MEKEIVFKSLLYDFYSELLTENQKFIVDMYYNNDLAISEISEELNISRQGIYDTLKRANNALEAYESKLGLVEKFLRRKELLLRINEVIDSTLCSKQYSIKELKDKIKEIKTIAEKMI